MGRSFVTKNLLRFVLLNLLHQITKFSNECKKRWFFHLGLCYCFVEFIINNEICFQKWSKCELVWCFSEEITLIYYITSCLLYLSSLFLILSAGAHYERCYSMEKFLGRFTLLQDSVPAIQREWINDKFVLDPLEFTQVSIHCLQNLNILVFLIRWSILINFLNFIHKFVVNLVDLFLLLPNNIVFTQIIDRLLNTWLAD